MVGQVGASGLKEHGSSTQQASVSITDCSCPPARLDQPPLEQLGCIIADGYQAAKTGFREASEAVVARTRCSELDRTANLVYRESYCGVLFGVPPDVVPEQAASKAPVPSVPLPFPVKTNTS